ncbi:MAG: hypothetical protein PHW60_05710 [Kiritimatiellae bacterium]|nr:hypothetical protein [Kiritimatiellia bacterium]
MLLRMGPFVPEDLNVVILFHFGPDEGHQCDMAEFDWYINGKFHAFLNFNNGSTVEEVTQGPFNMDLAQYLNKDLCSPFEFSFVCKSGDGSHCHEGAAFDFTWSTGNKKTWYISTSNPTKFTMCELSSALSDPP